jgi:sulfoxide reductase heme-binding subunit YedZ
MNPRYCPWLDRAGRLSWFKLATLILIVLPGLWIGFQLAMGWLQPKPVTEAIHQSGTWVVRFLLLSLAVTPLRRLGAWTKLISVRRMLGIAVLAYAAIHLSLYVVDQHLDLVHVASEIVLRFYLTIGFVALVGFAVLGSTSTDAMIRRLGTKRWNQLHRIVYGLGVLALLHFFLQAKLDITQPALMAGLFLLLMGHRLLQKQGFGESVAALLLLALVAAAGTALMEAGWYQAINHVPAVRVLQADLEFDSIDMVRPAWWVLAVGVGVVVLRLARALWARQPSRPVATRAGAARSA